MNHIDFFEMAKDLSQISLNLSQAAQYMSEKIKDALEADGVEIYLGSSDAFALECLLGESPWKDAKPDPEFLLALKRELGGLPMHYPDTRKEVWLYPYQSQSLFSFLAVPLLSGRNCVGCVVCSKRSSHSIGKEDTDHAKNLVGFMNGALLSAQLSQRLFISHEALEEANEKLQMALEELHATQDELVRSQKLAGLGELAAGVAHEINNPLLSILLNAESLRVNPVDPESIEIIISAAKRCKTIVGQLLLVSRESRGAEQIIELSQVIEESLRILKKQLEQEKIEVEIQIEGNPRVIGKSTSLVQAISNLISNAKDAIRETGGTGGKVTLKTKETPESSSIEIADNGCGIPSEDLPRIFDPFFTTKDVGKGTGLGLWVTYGIILRMGGRIRAESRPGKGTTFYLEFPKQPASFHEFRENK